MANSWILHFQFRGMTVRLLHDQSADDLAMQAFESYKVVPARAKETGLSRKELNEVAAIRHSLDRSAGNWFF